MSHPSSMIEHMFDTETLDGAEQALVDYERRIARYRARQLDLLWRLERAQVPAMDGARSIQEWVAQRLDVSPETAKDLVRLFRTTEEKSRTAADLEKGRISYDRACAESRLAEVAPSEPAADSRGCDIPGVWRMIARHRRVSRFEERRIFEERYLVLQPSLDESLWRLHGQLAGSDGRVVEKALQQRADTLPVPQHDGLPLSQRRADALTSICQDSLTGTSEEGTDRGEPLLTVFVDASVAAGSGGEAGIEVEAGPRLGPEALAELLCNGRIDFLRVSEGRALSVGDSQAVIPPRLRRYILWRDGGCVIEGCTSRYRLQVHHLVPRSEGGTNHETNLATLCWYHHHVAVHGQGHQIDPGSPAHRRRLTRRTRGP